MRRHATMIVLVILLMSGLIGGSASADDAGDDQWQSLFDGETLEGWEGRPEFWSVRDGAITGQTTPENPTKGNTFLIWRGGEPGDFELRMKYRIVGGNSGIQYRSVEHDNFVVGGYQADFEAGERYNGILYEERGRGILALRNQKVVIQEDGTREVVGTIGDEAAIVASIKKEDWNEYLIRARGNHLIQKINGLTTVDVTDHQESRRRMDGVIALQLHAGPPMLVQFKDIELKLLK